MEHYGDLDPKDILNDYIDCLIKFEINKDNNKSAIKGELKQLGISHRSLFPDLDGLSKSIRRDYGFLW